jgi:hypothetical protein
MSTNSSVTAIFQAPPQRKHHPTSTNVQGDVAAPSAAHVHLLSQLLSQLLSLQVPLSQMFQSRLLVLP